MQPKLMEQMESRRLFAAMPTYIEVDISQEYDSGLARTGTLTVHNLFAGAPTPAGSLQITATGPHGDVYTSYVRLAASGSATFAAGMYPRAFSFTYIPADATHAASARQMQNPVPMAPEWSTTRLSIAEPSLGTLRLRAEVLAINPSGTVTFTSAAGDVLGVVPVSDGVAELILQTAQTNLKCGQSITATYSGNQHHIGSSDSATFSANWRQRHEVLFADVNGDGHADRIFRETGTSPYTIEYLGDKGLIHTQTLPTAGAGWSLRETVDLTGDGNAEFVWQSQDGGKSVAWLRRPGTAFAYTGLGNTTPGWFIEGDGDFNGDGHDDLLWRNATTGRTCVWLMHGTEARGFELLNAAPGDSQWAIGEITDFDGDGNVDLLWRNGRTGGNYVWFLDGTRITGGRSLDALSADGWQLAGVFDLDADQDDDLLFYHRTTGQTLAWLLEAGDLAAAKTVTL